ncbi:Pectinesterase [Chitinophaga pinensis DSM 2588]|uniref:Pectinesterase n=1 Tax=Chitinophaga pinensis (strain ATCC 43595 / DSM 2588 / LMG 13176 / NBRC 15968 / NCIMB 11800 / UQM 2034) TaxID=485918 RepID=A0A979G2A3_CHIPD|nr:Pectinesterase [Chitinophaga pinensis DSM 2588]
MKKCFLIILFPFFLFLTASLRAQDPRARLVVAADGTGDYKTIQEAVNAVRDFTLFRVTIFIRKGIYHEKLCIPSWKCTITLQGEDRDSTVITNADYSGKVYPGKDASGRDKFGTFTSYTVLVAGDDIIAENLTFENAAGPVGQAVALHVEGDRCRFRNCRLLGNQDTLYAGKEDSRQYYQDCYIEGTTDFIFGAATVWFEGCTIHSKRDSYITAASTTQRQPYGFVFNHCKLTADSVAKKVFLGRPWRPYAATVFMNSILGPQILAQGWHNWDKKENELTARYAEYHNTGAGATHDKRVAWSRQLPAQSAKDITLTKVFGNWDPLK